MIYTRIYNVTGRYGWVLSLSLLAVYTGLTTYPITVNVAAWLMRHFATLDAVGAVMMGYSLALIVSVIFLRVVGEAINAFRSRVIHPLHVKECQRIRLERLMDELHRNK